MFAFIVLLRSGLRYTVRASEMRYGYDGSLELLAVPPAGEGAAAPAKRVVALFASNEVLSVVAREFLISEERPEPTPHVARSDDAIPF